MITKVIGLPGFVAKAEEWLFPRSKYKNVCVTYKTKLVFITCFLKVLLELQIHKEIKKSQKQPQWPHTQASLKMELSPREHRSFLSMPLLVPSWEEYGPCSLTSWLCLYWGCFRACLPVIYFLLMPLVHSCYLYWPLTFVYTFSVCICLLHSVLLASLSQTLENRFDE